MVYRFCLLQESRTKFPCTFNVSSTSFSFFHRGFLKNSYPPKIHLFVYFYSFIALLWPAPGNVSLQRCFRFVKKKKKNLFTLVLYPKLNDPPQMNISGYCLETILKFNVNNLKIIEHEEYIWQFYKIVILF